MASCCGDDYDRIVVRCLAILAGVVILSAAAPARAHHWFNANYDPDHPFTMTGVVTKVEWRNPHVIFYMDVVNERSGETTRWLMEMGSPNGLVRSGWSKATLKVGETITVEGSPLRGGTPMGYPRVITVAATGRRLTQTPP